MTLQPGIRLGPYEVLGPVGAGGMGEVYKARDTRLERTVAIKVLPADLAADVEFRARFEREARTISQLNHPHICTLYDVGEDQGTAYLVLEYLDGQTLAARLARGPLAVPDALDIATDIASALDAAHRHGIVHRDLKPGNVMIIRPSPSRQGSAQAKLLDFGLARAGTVDILADSADGLAPATAPITAPGRLLGTFQYMAPEQMVGAPADARTDMFAFGCVLYEMLTGRKAFAGSAPERRAATLMDQPPSVSAAQPRVPPALDYLVRACLARDPEQRLQSAHDLLLQLQWIADAGRAGVTAPGGLRRRPRERLAWLTAGVLAAVAAGAVALAIVRSRDRPAAVDPVQLAIAAAQSSTFTAPVQFAISPDGRQIVFTASTEGPPLLWVRALATLDARPLAGTERATFPFWSPDSRSVGFFAAGKLKRVPVNGGPPIDVCDAVQGVGGAWSEGNVIVFAPAPTTSLSRVDAAGGTPTAVTKLADGETYHRFPAFLPDGRHVIHLAQRGSTRELRLASLDSPETTALVASDSNGLYASGHLLFSRGGALWAQPFDLPARTVSGDGFIVSEQVPAMDSARAFFSASTTGVLGYVRGPLRPNARLTWLDSTGQRLGIVGDPGAYANLSLSPDERRVAVSLTAPSGTGRDIWIIDLARADNRQRLTFDPAAAADPSWSPDGSQVLFTSNRYGRYNSAFVRPADFGGEETLVLKMERLIQGPDWSHNGRLVVFAGGQAAPTTNDLWMLPRAPDGKPTVMLQTPAIESSPAFSPDDRWIAYDSDVSGRLEVYIRAVARGSGEFKVSRDGGWAPRWRGDGSGLFFLGLDGTMMAADITFGKAVHATVPRILFRTPLLRTADQHTYAVTRDGRRFLMPVPDQPQGPLPITVALNWLALVRKPLYR